ncbi:Hypothetical predicted protein [Olea europaea subsp. europaea]|uniref:Uncharacterized protein n=1 Tax=Olea europaea subsp. europaea TaxID=158383 RepID=A0A8S0S549_OLEEU|nr:Hypothetical predicted protein [Olea europaea subsp. europaea]
MLSKFEELEPVPTSLVIERPLEQSYIASASLDLHNDSSFVNFSSVEARSSSFSISVCSEGNRDEIASGAFAFSALEMAVRTTTTALYRRRASSRVPPPISKPAISNSSISSGGDGGITLSSGGGPNIRIGGLQSLSFMAERIKKAASIVSSRCFWPSIASSCVVLEVV